MEDREQNLFALQGRAFAMQPLNMSVEGLHFCHQFEYSKSKLILLRSLEQIVT